MNISDFSFDLPQELIAQAPVVPRDSARLFVYHRLEDRVEHRHVRDLPDILPPRSLLIANNSRVRKSRLAASFNERPVELLVLEPAGPATYQCLVGGRKIRPGSHLQVWTDSSRTQIAPLRAEVVDMLPNPGMTTFLVRFSGEDDLEAAFDRYAEVPLPPYISGRESTPDQYQTVYAKDIGSAAAPTAGLHFTPELIERLRANGHSWDEVTLHVGLGTFLPLREEEVEKNHLHTEHSFISDDVAAAVAAHPGSVIPIGTTSARTLESHAQDGSLEAGWNATDLFIYPGYVFKQANGLLTNFHLPHSSLLMLVAALLGNHPSERRLIAEPEEMAAVLRRLYAEAIDERYRFFSFGDAMLIL